MSTSLRLLAVLTVLLKYATVQIRLRGAKRRAPRIHGLLPPLASTPCEKSGLTNPEQTEVGGWNGEQQSIHAIKHPAMARQ